MKKLIILLISFQGYSQQVDKVAHFGVGYVATATTSALMSKQTPWKSITLSFTTAVVIGGAKELYDLKVKKTAFNGKDFFWTVMGGASGIVTIRWTIRKTI
jgi:uncharacterized protein YfiM (DUF2279 family)